jgi:hypothetical protein
MIVSFPTLELSQQIAIPLSTPNTFSKQYNILEMIPSPTNLQTKTMNDKSSPRPPY